MKYQYLLISVFLIVSPVYASCICEDGSQGKTIAELQQEQTDLEIQLHNTQVMNRRAEEALQVKIAEKQSARISKEVVPSFNEEVVGGINWYEPLK